MMSATWRRNVLLPAMLGPVSSQSRSCSSSEQLLATNGVRGAIERPFHDRVPPVLDPERAVLGDLRACPALFGGQGSPRQRPRRARLRRRPSRPTPRSRRARSASTRRAARARGLAPGRQHRRCGFRARRARRSCSASRCSCFAAARTRRAPVPDGSPSPRRNSRAGCCGGS